MRLDKYLADMQIGTRSQVKELIRKGKVLVDDIKIMSPEFKVDENSTVKVDNQIVGYASVEYYLLNKPDGVLSATYDKNTKTVLDLIESKKRKDLFPVGRLDKDTHGLLIITNDGELAHKLLSPKKHVDKVYFARINGRVWDKHIEEFASGITLEDGLVTMPAHLNIIKSSDISEIELTIHEGKFHQVKRMFEAIGCEVIYLQRIAFGPIKLDTSLAEGEYRALTDEEIKQLYEATN